MSGPQPQIEISNPPRDVEMTGDTEASAPTAEEEQPAAEEAETAAAAGEPEDTTVEPDPVSQANKFLEYLKSPIVELVVGQGDEQTTLTAHQAILTTSPYFSELIENLDDASPRRITLQDETIDAVSAFLQCQYTGEYFPRRLFSPSDGLETDPGIPELDQSGDHLLRHARIYTLARKLGLDKLKSLAQSKIHRVNSTARGEISYARYVYANTDSDDRSIRKPVAAFWATRSHVLRHEAEMEFRSMCLEYPQFGFDVLNLVLDQKEKRSDRDAGTPSSKGNAKKRARLSK